MWVQLVSVCVHTILFRDTFPTDSHNTYIHTECEVPCKGKCGN